MQNIRQLPEYSGYQNPGDTKKPVFGGTLLDSDDADDDVCESGGSLSLLILSPQLVVMIFDLQGAGIDVEALHRT